MGYGDTRGDAGWLGALRAALGDRWARGGKWRRADNEGCEVGGGTPRDGCAALDEGGRAKGGV